LNCSDIEDENGYNYDANGPKDTYNRSKYPASKKEESKGEKNIRRRVYDALNV
jgi:hypothetical protein